MDRPAEPDLRALMAVTGYSFIDESLLRLALVHRSYQAEHGEPESNERLEFLGDAVLGWVIADLAYRRRPDADEGRLSDLRQAVVNTGALADRAREISLGDYVMLGQGESSGGGRDKDSILADAFEAVIGAIYLDGGESPAASFVRRMLSASVEEMIPVLGSVDAKTGLQELCAAEGRPVPRYDTEGEGPDHDRVFTATVTVGSTVLGTGRGRTKKAAEQVAARAAIAALSH
ncbi:MAG: ribonuclease III [Actinomycetota bacterium]